MRLGSILTAMRVYLITSQLFSYRQALWKNLAKESAHLNPGTLVRVRVIEWGNFVSGPFRGKVLAEIGAEVIKVEPPGTGGDSRSHDPFPGHIPHPERGGLFLFNNINKRGVSLNLNKAPGREVLGELLKSADFFYPTNTLGLQRKSD